MNEEIRRLLEEYGEEILESEEFQKAYRQKHHKIMTVADHSLGVAIISLRICRLLEKMHINVHEKELIISALCHDLGILGRDEKYKNDLECCSRHPKDSIPDRGREPQGRRQYPPAYVASDAAPSQIQGRLYSNSRRQDQLHHGTNGQISRGRCQL